MSRSNLETGFLLDRQWHLLRGEMDSTKKSTLLALAKVLAEAGLAHAIIGGIAVQVHLDDPRTTLDIDLAVPDRGSIPGDRLRAAGFQHVGAHAYSENWRGPDGTPVQFTDDAALKDALGRADTISLDGVILRVLAKPDLLHAKLRAGADAARRRSKRLQDLADAQALLEQSPELDAELTSVERALIDALP